MGIAQIVHNPKAGDASHSKRNYWKFFRKPGTKSLMYLQMTKTGKNFPGIKPILFFWPEVTGVFIN